MKAILRAATRSPHPCYQIDTQALPEAPTKQLGVLVDFFAFFWCEIALGIAVAVVYANLMREMRKSTLEKEAEARGQEEEDTARA